MKFTIKLESGLPYEQLVAKMLYHSRASDIHDYALAFYLYEFDKGRLYKKTRAKDTPDFAEKKLTISARKANDLLRIRLLEAAFEPPGNDFPGWNVVRGMAFPAGGIDAVGRIHGLGRGGVVLVVPVGVGFAVTVHTGHVGRRVPADQ